EVAPGASRGKKHEFKFRPLEVGLGGDLERPAIVLRASHDYERGVNRKVASRRSKTRESVARQFLKACLPIGNDSRATFEFRMDRRHESPVRAGSREAEEVARLAAGFFRDSETQSDTAVLRADDAFGGARQIPRNGK